MWWLSKLEGALLIGAAGGGWLLGYGITNGLAYWKLPERWLSWKPRTW